MTTICKPSAVLLLALSLAAPVHADDVFLRIDRVPENGLVVAEVDLTAAAQWCGVAAVTPEGIRAAADSGATIQFVPAADFDPQQHVRGVLVARLPGGGSARLRLEFDAGAASAGEGSSTVETAGFQVVHDPAKQGGLPTRLVFRGTGKTLESIGWQDRLHHTQHGGFRIADDPQSKVTRIADGPLCTAVRVASRFVRGDGTAPDSKPDAVYQWLYLRDQPLVFVTVVQRQQQPFTWNEAHFLEWHQSGDELPQWAGGNPVQKGEFQGADRSQPFRDWAAMHDGRNAVAVLRSGEMLIYDGKGGYGPYLHAHGSLAWTPWSGTERRLSAWLWIGSDDDPLQSIGQAAERLPTQARVTVTVGRVHKRLEQARADVERLTGDAQRQARRQLAVAERLESRGRFQESLDAVDGKLPRPLHMLSAGDLGLLLEQTATGIRVLQLLDAAAGVELMAPQPLPLFSLTLRRNGSKDDMQVAADDGWREARIERLDDSRVRLTWSGARRGRLGRTASRIRGDAGSGGRRDSLDAARRTSRRLDPAAGRVSASRRRRPGPRGGCRVPARLGRSAARAVATCVSLLGPILQRLDDHAVAGGLRRCPADRPVRRRTRSGGGDQGDPAGKPSGRARGRVRVRASVCRDGPTRQRVPVVRRSGLAAAARRLVRRGPDLSPMGRAECEMVAGAGARRTCRHAAVDARAAGLGQTGGGPASVVPRMKRFAEALGVPVGIHWYSWHQIPFDNDYPHYFPALDGFEEGVAELQRSGVYVMPYINGRLWDTRDRGQEDFEFTKVARPAATKDEAGEPYVESYGSKEQDGSRVQLAAMCPTTEVWRNKVHEIVGRLMNECGVKGVYIDQVAAAQPQLCFDRSHGHPAGGGDWWTAGYWEMLNRIRKDLPPDRMLTTECNAEPYAHVFDGYLTWHWQYDGQVPAFPAVYGGALQMFGRAYRGGPTKDLALRMKAGQQLVFGEQIGWLDPSVVDEAENFAFFRQVVRLRWLLKRYFYAGQMARPPKLIGQIPRVTADWQWSGEWPVTTDALLAGAWSAARREAVGPVVCQRERSAADGGLRFRRRSVWTGRGNVRGGGTGRGRRGGEMDGFAHVPPGRDVAAPHRASLGTERPMTIRCEGEGP